MSNQIMYKCRSIKWAEKSNPKTIELYKGVVAELLISKLQNSNNVQ